MKIYVDNFVAALLNDYHNYVIVFPNNDLGSSIILEAYDKLKNNARFRIFPSLRFEYFLTLLKNAQFIIGNSSAGIREAPYYYVPTVDIGTRQNNRAKLDTIFNCSYETEAILEAIKKVKEIKKETEDIEKEKFHFGKGRSDKLFLKLLNSEQFWNIEHQKQFQEI